MSRKLNAEGGFTLIELAIVIAILGLVGVAGMQMLSGSLKNAQLTGTRDRLELAAGSVIAFMAERSRLPCPADGDLGSGDAGYGREDCSATLAVTRGVLPWRTLGLPDASALDGWNRLISYRVTPALTVAGSGGGAGTLDVRYLDASGVPGSLAGFLVFSHGLNGFGAWTITGNRLTVTGASTTELENLDTDLIYITPAQTPPANDVYDDHLTWRSSAQVAQILGILPGPTCTAADTAFVSLSCAATPTNVDACTVVTAAQVRCP